MQNGHIEINIDTAISRAAEPGISQAVAVPRAGMSFLKHTNKPLPPTLQKSSNIFHNTASAMRAVLYASRPCSLRLTRSVSSRAFFVACPQVVGVISQRASHLNKLRRKRMSVIKKEYHQIKDCIKPGDVIAFSGDNPVSQVIKAVTDGQISHVAVVLAVGLSIDRNSDRNCFNLVAEASHEGVRITSLSGLQKAYKGKIWWLPLSCECRERLEQNFSCFCDLLINNDGKPYDYAQAIMEGLEELIGDRYAAVRSAGDLFSLLIGSNGRKFIRRLINHVQVEDINSMQDFKDRLIKALSDPTLTSTEPAEDVKRQFCSELATRALKVGGVLPDTDNIDPERVTPSELCQFKIYEKCIQFKGDCNPEEINDFNSKDPCQWQE